jgi:cation diffusion facilitator family transporter
VRAQGHICNLVGLCANVALAALKFVVATMTGSVALLADAWHSVGDTLQTAITAFGFTIAGRPPDEGHPYGHGNFETVAALFVSLVLLGTGAWVTFEAVEVLVAGGFEAPGLAALPVAAIAVVGKEALARYTMRVGKSLNSPAITVAAKDHRADALSSGAAVAGILGARAGVPILDPIAALVIGVSILVLAFPALRQTLAILVDAAPRGDLGRRIVERFRDDPAVRSIHAIRIHPVGSYYDIDLEIDVDGDLPVREGHAIAHRVRDAILTAEPFVVEVKVHVNPHPERDGEVGASGSAATRPAPARIIAPSPPGESRE